MSKQSTIFSGAEKNITEQDCIDILKEKNYIIIKLDDLDTTQVKTAKELVSFFYATLSFYNRSRLLHYGKTTKKDLKLASSFIKIRQEEAGLSKGRAVQECAMIVRCVIANEPKFSLSEPLHNMECFGQENMRWVTDKAISIINGENKKIEEEKYNKYIEDLYGAQEKIAIENIDNKHVENLKDILGDLENG